ncbi:hypothetical protein QBC47DRAFT_152098 [Echria macrotheca]|uniref:Single-strand DNA deaminase toxin A-like C-terminal domain-containing protein n=1 Tax=Echria macrotheca TaxID=438768 RepID=A0AAJ0B377_9PEZI|nr:hypothetical protein QBC47DRAFT_152098 [Echria macrotheca]
MFHHGDKLVVVKAVATVDVGQKLERNTTGFIQPLHQPGIRMLATSGWSGPKDNIHLIDNELYTDLVMKAARSIGFKLSKDRWDAGYRKAKPEEEGRSQACHIEKKLSLWWVRKCIKYAWRSGSRDVVRPEDLRDKFNLPDAMKEACIFLDHTACHGVSTSILPFRK